MSVMKHVNELGNAVWIGTDYEAVPVITHKFTAYELSNAELVISGLGYFEASLNGCLVSDDKFQPVVSDYEKREFNMMTYPCRDKFTHRIYVCKYNISELMKLGENILEITLGNGWYRQGERMAEGDVLFGSHVKTIFAVNINGRTITVSDGSETWRKSEIIYSNLFIGEIHDKTYIDKTEYPVDVLSAPESILSEQIGVPDRIIRIISPKKIGVANGKTVWDAGENISGVVRITKPEGVAVLRFAEILNEDGSLNFTSTGSEYVCRSGKPQIMTDTFIGSGIFEPKFVWHAFRYFDVEGEIDSAEVLVIHSDVPVTSEFTSSSEGLNFLYDAYIRTQLDNMHGSFPSDCPHRERLGYTGDGQVCAEAGMMLLDSREFYKKWIYDILDCQSTDNGHVQHTAPFQGGGGGPGGWGCAMIIVPYYYYRTYGDTELIKECYKPMRKWVGYLIEHSENNLVVREEPNGWCLGDWSTIGTEAPPNPLVNTYFFIRSLRMLSEMAEVLGYSEHLEEYRKLDSEMCNALYNTYFNGEHFVDERLGSDALAIDIGIAPKGLDKSVAEYYKKLGAFDAGFLSTDVIFRVLFENGHEDVALELFESELVGSFLYMKRNGATTIWESWTGVNSFNHPMFGSSTRYLFTYLLGMTYRKAGWQEIVIAPKLPKKLEYIKGSIETVRGRISVEIEQKNADVLFKITLPENVEAKFVFEENLLDLHGGQNELCLKR